MDRRIAILSALRSLKNVMYFSDKSLPSTMKAWNLTEYGSDSNLLIMDQTKVPSLLDYKDVLVKVKAASLNPFDSLMQGGFGSVFLNGLRKWNKVDEFPLILGRDFSGVVVKKGNKVTRFKEGDEVWGTPAVWRAGTFAEYCRVGQDELAAKPQKLNHIEAGSFPYVHCTVWSALRDTAGLTERNARNKRVFIVGGSGGLGTLAIQLMKAWGAHVTTTCGSDAVELMKRMGADNIIDYKTEDVAERIRGEFRFDVILDTVGGHLDLFYASTSCQRSTYILLAPPMLDHIDESGVFLGTLRSGAEFLTSSVSQLYNSNISYKWGFFRPSAPALNHLREIINEGKVVPVIDSVYHFADLPSAFDRLRNGHLRGKLMLNFESSS